MTLSGPVLASLDPLASSIAQDRSSFGPAEFKLSTSSLRVAAVCRDNAESLLPSLQAVLPSAIKFWLADTGTAVHLANRGDLTAEEVANIKIVPPIHLHTPNGVVCVKEALDKYIPSLNVSVEVMVMQDSPNALSVGRLVRQSGLDFIWEHEEPDDPVFILPDGSTVHGSVKYDTPVISHERGDGGPGRARAQSPLVQVPWTPLPQTNPMMRTPARSRRSSTLTTSTRRAFPTRTRSLQR